MSEDDEERLFSTVLNRVFFFLPCVWFCHCVNDCCNHFPLCLPGGASCQTEGGEDPSCLGENQGGAGQKGRTSLSSFWRPHRLLSIESSCRLLSDRRLVMFAAHCASFVDFIHSEAATRRRGKNRSLQCLIVCICRGGSKKSERGSRKRALPDNVNALYTKHLIHAIPSKRTLIFWGGRKNWANRIYTGIIFFVLFFVSTSE